MTQATASRLASFAAALAMTASLFFGVNGIAHASTQTAAVAVAQVASDRA